MIRKKISIGIPCFNEEENIAEVYESLSNIASLSKGYQYEFIFVDNGSVDKTAEEIRRISGKDKKVVGVFLARNFGPEASTQAALDYATGDAFIVYEADMQDPAEMILNFIKKWEEGYRIIIGVRTKTEDRFLMGIARKTFYKILKSISNIDVPVNAGTFGLIDRKVIDALKHLPEKYRFYRGLRAWVGFKTFKIVYHRRARKHGKSSYSLLGYVHHAERSFFGFSYLPLNIIVYAGLTCMLISFIIGSIYLIFSLFYKNLLSIEFAIFLAVVFFGGIQLVAISIIGKYTEVIVEETKSRPIYITDEVINGKDKI